MPLPIGTILDNRYKIIGVLGQGGFGITYLAEDINNTWKRAIKQNLPKDLAVEARRNDGGYVVQPTTSDYEDALFEQCQKFVKEAELLKKLEHTNIVQIVDLFVDFGTVFYAMNYLEGVTLTKWMAKNPNRSEEQILNITLSMLDGLEYLHQQEIVHRDVKPDNIFITDDGFVKILDFGAARISIKNGHITVPVGTTGYMPPEQINPDSPLSKTIDIFAVAATMYHMIVGHRPYKSLHDLTVVGVGIPKLATNPDLTKRYSLPFLQTIDKCLSFNPKDRYQSISEMRNGLLGKYAKEEENRRREKEAWERAERTKSTDAYVSYIADFPNGKYVDKARDRINELVSWNAAKTAKTESAYRDYIRDYPKGLFVRDAYDAIEKIKQDKKNQADKAEVDFWNNAKKNNKISEYEAYLKKYPSGKYIQEANDAIDRLKKLEQPARVNIEFKGHNVNTVDKEKSADNKAPPPIPVIENNGELMSLSRLGRFHYFSYKCLCISLHILITTVAIIFNSNFVFSLNIAIIIFAIVLDVRRLHDINKTGWMSLIPFVSLYLFFPESKTTNNQYGRPVIVKDKTLDYIFMSSPLICIVLIFITDKILV